MKLSILVLIFCVYGDIKPKDQTSFYKGLVPETNFYSETGYVNVKDQYDNNFYYYLYLQENALKIDDVKDDDNLILWLFGGPGCSSIDSSFMENGPYYFEGKTLKLRDKRWNKLSHLLYLDQPFGAGLSYSTNPDKVKDSFRAADYVLLFLKEFVAKYPIFSKTKFYIFGESYAGHYIPVLAQTIMESDLNINYQGVAIGGPFVNGLKQGTSYHGFLYSFGFVDDQRRDKVIAKEGEGQSLVFQQQYSAAALLWGDLFAIEGYTGGADRYNVHQYGIVNYNYAYIPWLNQNRKQFEFPDNITYQDCNHDIYNAFLDDIGQSTEDQLVYLLDVGKVLLWNGQLDYLINAAGTLQLINSLNWSGIDQWKKGQKKFLVNNGETIGTYKQVGGFTHSVIYQAGHMLAKDNPESAFILLQSFLSDKWD